MGTASCVRRELSAVGRTGRFQRKGLKGWSGGRKNNSVQNGKKRHKPNLSERELSPQVQSNAESKTETLATSEKSKLSRKDLEERRPPASVRLEKKSDKYGQIWPFNVDPRSLTKPNRQRAWPYLLVTI
jgi:hypothetical protein